MSMPSEQRELFRKALLNVLDTNASRFGLSVGGLITFLEIYGFRNAPGSDVAAELQYLCDKGLVAPIGKQISPENVSWRITAEGRDFLATNA
jgi:hypothetical protein